MLAKREMIASIGKIRIIIKISAFKVKFGVVKCRNLL